MLKGRKTLKRGQVMSTTSWAIFVKIFFVCNRHLPYPKNKFHFEPPVIVIEKYGFIYFFDTFRQIVYIFTEIFCVYSRDGKPMILRYNEKFFKPMIPYSRFKNCCFLCVKNFSFKIKPEKRDKQSYTTPHYTQNWCILRKIVADA